VEAQVDAVVDLPLELLPRRLAADVLGQGNKVWQSVEEMTRRGPAHATAHWFELE
jgi:hypothetical protein